jgi:hypothetical protein
MLTARQGSNLKIEIRLVLLALGRDPKFDFGRMTIEELKTMKRELHNEWKAMKAIAE